MKVTKETPTNKKVKLKKTIKNKSPPEKKKATVRKKNVKGEVCNRRFQNKKKNLFYPLSFLFLFFFLFFSSTLFIV